MKGAWFVALLLTVSVAYAAYPDAVSYFTFKSVNCSADGVITFDVTHSGESLKISDLNPQIEGEKLAKQKLLGSWWQAGWLMENYTGVDFVSTTRFTFISNTGIYTQGKYIVTLNWPSNSVYNDNIKFAVNCPGVPCTSDDQCIGQQSCIAKTCQWLSCAQDEYASGHACFKRCEDNNACTNDYFIDNSCVHSPKENCCVADKDCNAYERCSDNICTKPLFAPSNDNFFTRFIKWLTGRK